MSARSRAVLLAAMLTGGAVAADAEGLVDPAKLVLEVEPVKSRFVLYEPVGLVYRFVNPLDTPIVASRRILGGVTFTVTSPSGSRTEYVSDLPHVFSALVMRRFEPRSSTPDYTELKWRCPARRADPVFPVPGEYVIHAETNVGATEPIRSEPVHVTIVAPSPVDQATIASFESLSEFQELQCVGAFGFCLASDSPCVSGLIGLVSAHTESAYTPGIAYSLAISKRRFESSSEVARTLRSYVESWVTRETSEWDLYRIARIYEAIDRSNWAQLVIYEAEVRFPEGDLAAVFRRTSSAGRDMKSTPPPLTWRDAMRRR